MSSFYAVDFKDGKLGILDTSDKIVEYYTPSEVKDIIKRHDFVINGVSVLDEKTNPMFSLDGLKINLAYRTHKKFGRWIVALLREGDRYGSTLSSVVKKDTVFFYDSSVSWSRQEYPYGQFVSSYYLDTIFDHEGGLCLDASVSSWVIDSETMDSILDWLAKVV